MPTLASDELAALTHIANRLADAAAKVTLRHFRSNALDLQNKEAGGGFDPVTLADRGAEEAMRAILARERPDDGILGEEIARTHGTSGLTWVIDPIDGTRAYISGLPVWGTLIALDDGRMGRIGLIDQPFTGERFLGVLDDAGNLAELRRNGARTEISSRPSVGLDDALMFTTDPYLFEGPEAEAFATVRERARLTRYGTDCYAYALLAMGQIDLVVESGLKAYDVAALVPLIQAAGGIMTDWRGGDCRWGGRVLAAGNAGLHAQVVEILSTVP